ncbi:hypothetical protein [Kitasatospora phosalacinea]|uniref:Deoxyxylulose-5-phosphate synthase n=1 Tax=Kitasatospora phosalacinea TaxID=2065 RepID=A0A9W6PIL7_9ACTN|nr:hypothetical protein [Kitasatospora phosalacinea]GLW56885.1 hypothetical protein Kpho01_48960 [Kitasatospora phosalacinea]
MCFRGGTGSRHHVCLPCRASYKRRAGGTAVCPRCRGPLIDAGQDLHVPRRSDAAAWRALGALLRAGVRFESGCCDGPGWRPRTPREVRERLAASLGTGLPAVRALTTRDVTDLAGHRRAARQVPRPGRPQR